MPEQALNPLGQRGVELEPLTAYGMVES